MVEGEQEVEGEEEEGVEGRLQGRSQMEAVAHNHTVFGLETVWWRG